MKIRRVMIGVMSVAVLASCTKDLDTVPINKNDFTADVVYDTPESYAQTLSQIYGGYVLVGANEGSADIAVSDAGASELNRAWWSLQETTTDAVKNAWGDAGIPELNFNTWTTTKNNSIFAVYNRVMILVTRVNEYLRETTDAKLSERGVGGDLYNTIQRYRAEARFLRAYAYWMGLDGFGRMPFATESTAIGVTPPPQAESGELFDYIESELLALTEDQYFSSPGGATYPQVDKAAAWGLLARLYLNGEIYTGQSYYAEAMAAAQEVINGGYYALSSSYKSLFMGDNGTNFDARKELIYAVAYDAVNTKSYGGTSFLINAGMSWIDSEGKSEVFSGGWGGLHIDRQYIDRFYDVSVTAAVENDRYTSNDFESDDERATLFVINGRTDAMESTGDVTQGWASTKFSNRGYLSGVNEGTDPFSSTDYPMIRLAEIYLIYAEANLRNGGSPTDATSLRLLNDVAGRSIDNYTPLTSYDLETLFTERSRELFWEGHRRTDLIRYDRYSSGDYLWSWKGGVESGASFSSHLERFPLPVEDLSVNPNLSQNSGY